MSVVTVHPQGLHPFAYSNLESDLQNANLSKNFYRAIKLTSEIAYVAFAIGSLVVIGGSNATMIPLIILGTMLNLPVFDTLIHSPLESRQYANAREHALLTRVMERVFEMTGGGNTVDRFDIDREVSAVGVFPAFIEGREHLKDQKKLLELIARYEYWKEQAEIARDHVSRLESGSHNAYLKLQTTTDPKERELDEYEMQLLRERAYVIEEKTLLTAKIEAAYALNVLGNLRESKKLSDYGTFQKLDMEQRLLFNQEGYDPYFILNDEPNQPITRDYIKNASIHEIAHRLFDFNNALG